MSRDWPSGMGADGTASPVSALASHALLEMPSVAALLCVPPSVEGLWVLEQLDGLLANVNLAYFLLAREEATGRRNCVRSHGVRDRGRFHGRAVYRAELGGRALRRGRARA